MTDVSSENGRSYTSNMNSHNRSQTDNNFRVKLEEENKNRGVNTKKIKFP